MPRRTTPPRPRAAGSTALRSRSPRAQSPWCPCVWVGELAGLVALDPGDRISGVVREVVARVVDARDSGDPVVLQQLAPTECAGQPDDVGVVQRAQSAILDDRNPLTGAPATDAVGREDVVHVWKVHRGEAVLLRETQERLVPVLSPEPEVDHPGLRALRQIRPGVVVLPQRLDLTVALRVRADGGVVEVVPPRVGEARIVVVAIALDDIPPELSVPPPTDDLGDLATLDVHLDMREVAGVVAHAADDPVEGRQQGVGLPHEGLHGMSEADALDGGADDVPGLKRALNPQIGLSWGHLPADVCALWARDVHRRCVPEGLHHLEVDGAPQLVRVAVGP